MLMLLRSMAQAVNGPTILSHKTLFPSIETFYLASRLLMENMHIAVRRRTKGYLLPRSTSLQLRYESERLELQKRVTEQLVSDVFGLYEKSLFVDLKLEASRGNVYCHQLFFAARVPALWQLLLEIAKFQQPYKKPAGALICIQLPDVEYKELQKFTRSLYSDQSNRAAGVVLRRKLEDTLAVLQQRALLYTNQIRIERLSSDEEHHVQQLILKQLRLGHLSEKKGNIQDVERFICSNGVQCTYQTRALSDTDSNSTVTLKPHVIKNSPNTSKSVRPKSSQKICAQKPKSLRNTMNITNHTVVNIDKCEIKEKQQTGVSEEVCGNCDNNIEDDLESSATLTRKGKISLKGPLPTKRTSNDDQSPSGQLSNQESPVFNVSMIKELQTSPMQVSGESFQDKLRDKRERSPSRSQRSSTSEFTPVEPLHNSNVLKNAIVCSNGDVGPFYPASVRVKEGKPHKYGAMSSTKENASLHQANILARQQLQQQQPVQSGSTSKTYLQRKSQSFGAESQDGAELDNVSVSNSGSDYRLSNLHETSSLEVELPSSHEENSSSHDSDESLGTSYKRLIENPRGDYNNDLKTERNQNIVDEKGKTAPEPVNPKRPLVRARTFEVLDAIISDPSDKSKQEPTEKKETEAKGSAAIKVEHGMLGEAQSSHPTFTTLKRNVGTQGLGKDNLGNGKERKVSDESITSYYDNADDPERLREMERKKGSLIFEHNFQTYSNIPTTNMMTASMMTASMSSESGSMGVGSLYSSMMDSAMMGSIHSLGALEAPVVDPIPRPASVGLPVRHTVEDANSELPHVVSHRPPLRVQQSTEEMAIELQQEIAKRGSATRSPSPDSLSVDFVARREAETSEKEKTPKKIKKTKSIETSSSSMNKEEMDNEEKEQDDKENESKSNDSGQNEKKTDKKEVTVEEPSFKALSQIIGSPRLSREISENTPIISGGSTLKREKDTAEKKSLSKRERQVSIGSVKDVDSIPLVCGYIGPQDDEEEQKEGKVQTKETNGEGEDEKHQSIFPMFIDLNAIPTPSAEETKEAEKKEALKAKNQSSAVYMYIEADTVSPKNRRKRKSESDGAAISKSIEPHPDIEFTSLPPVLAAPVDEKEESDGKKVEVDGGSDEGGNKEKKGFFMFIEAESSSKQGSPKPRRRTIPPPKKKTENPMTRSAPSDSILFSTPESASKLMTKSVIDREEFIAQPPTRKNVSLNDKINESSTSRDGSFVSGIPRPIHALKSKASSSKSVHAKPSPHKRDPSTQRDHSVSWTKDEHASETTNDMATSRDISVSELGPSQSVSFSEIMSTSLPQETEPSEVSDVSSLLSSIERSNGRLLLITCQSQFSADSVLVALKHIYSGTSTVPEGVRVGELAALADMLALDGLKDVISLHLKAKMCHYFHKPCSGCLEGVLDVLPIAGAYCLDELYHRCLRWVAKHFVVVLPTRNYAALPPEVQDRCLKQLLDDMSVSNVIDNALGCERVLSSLPMVRWAQPVFDSAAQLLEAATSFIATNMSGVLASDRFLALGRDSGWSIESLQDTMRVACELIRPDQAVLSHIQLAKFLEQSQDGLPEVSENFLNFLENLLNQIEKFMIHNANRVAVCRKWPLLSTGTQRRIKDAALVIVEFSRPTAPRPKLSSTTRRVSARRPPTSSQDPARCQTPPATLSRPRTQTPPPTRASTLRAQARQAAIQRSQSARTVAERPRKSRQEWRLEVAQ
ncbi:BTB/POZ domain-containing protein 8-like [Homarus americanus]|uniref:BTB/POZ domain-containing protein 8-like n=1 Tax=Homarus americanus TaxID=6706 RepID=A0A8J5MKI5_HOMAM|nr:BTB/POZ domain-containing protein 8-like [Homarus americanus]